MPIFGQVWLWSLLAFLLGALLCWVLVVLPVRRRLDAVERKLSTIRTETKHGATATPSAPPTAERSLPAHDSLSDRQQPATDRMPERSLPAHDRRSERPGSAQAHRSTPSIVPGFGDSGRDDDDEIPVDNLTRAYAMPALDGPPAPPADEASERGALSLSGPEPEAGATQYLGTLGAPLGVPGSRRDWFADEPDRNLVDDAADEADDGRATIFTQRTMPIPVELIRSLDTAAPQPEEQDASLVDDLEDEPAAEPAPVSEAHTTVMSRLTAPQPEPEPEAPEPAELVEPRSHAASNGSAAPAEPEVPAAAAAEPEAEDRVALLSTAEPSTMHGVTVETERTPSALPKRIPSKPQHRVPFGVPTSSPAAAPASTGTERMRSLFEPMIPAEGGANAVPPPPHRLRTADSRPSAPGPFGPGSAMPLPGGASPSPEFTVKASVTALRYCTPESSQFGRTVAEVWFRSAADAERVGFRPVG